MNWTSVGIGTLVGIAVGYFVFKPKGGLEIPRGRRTHHLRLRSSRKARHDLLSRRPFGQLLREEPGHGDHAGATIEPVFLV